MTPEEKSGLVLRLLSAKNLIAAVVELIEEVKAEERAACAKQVENWLLASGGLDKLAAAIRARP
jgi:hypothetical protein